MEGRAWLSRLPVSLTSLQSNCVVQLQVVSHLSGHCIDDVFPVEKRALFCNPRTLLRLMFVMDKRDAKVLKNHIFTI
jgi:hypothetical protein